RREVVLDDDGRVFVEADVAAVRTTLLLLGANDDALDDVALLDTGAGNGVLDRGDEDVADRGVTTASAAEHLDAQHFLAAAVVGAAKARLLLDHLARPRPSVTRQRLFLLIGRVSITRTLSPTLTSLVSSCA